MSKKISELTTSATVALTDYLIGNIGGVTQKFLLSAIDAVSHTFTANQIISVTDNTNAALRITQTGTGNALVVEDSANPDSTPFVINASGQVGVGITPVGKLSVYDSSSSVIGVLGEGTVAIYSSKASDDAGYATLQFRKSRGTIALPTIVQNGDIAGAINWYGYDGSAIKLAAILSAEVDGTPGTNDMPGRLVFSTTADGASSPTERLRINSSGNVGIGATTISARTHIVSTTEQLRIGYDATKYATWTVNSSGDLAIDPVGKLDITGATKYVLGKEIDFEVGAGVIGWRDLIADIQIRNNPATDPTWAQIGTSPFWAYRFDVGDKVWITFHVNHDYYPGGQILLHTHWISSGTNTTNSVKWQFTYSVMKGHNQTGGDLSTTGTVVTAENVSGGQYRHMISEIASSITVTNAEVDSLICVVIERITNGATDNTDNIFLLTADCHYQASRFATPQKAPNFYS